MVSPFSIRTDTCDCRLDRAYLHELAPNHRATGPLGSDRRKIDCAYWIRLGIR
jgi:hypothetical protein